MVNHSPVALNALLGNYNATAPAKTVKPHHGRGSGIVGQYLQARRRSVFGGKLGDRIGSQRQIRTVVVGSVEAGGITAVDDALAVAAVDRRRDHHIIVAAPSVDIDSHRNASLIHVSLSDESKHIGGSVVDGMRVSSHAPGVVGRRNDMTVGE